MAVHSPDHCLPQAVSLTDHGVLEAGEDGHRWGREPVGFGRAGDQLVTLWHGPGRHQLVQWHSAQGGEAHRRLELTEAIRADLVAPLPDGSVVLASSRQRQPMTGQVWSGDGDLLAEADLGDAIGKLSVDPQGQLWLAYLGEAMGSGLSEDGAAFMNGLHRRDRLLRQTWASSSSAIAVCDRTYIFDTPALTTATIDGRVQALVSAHTRGEDGPFELLRIDPEADRIIRVRPAAQTPERLILTDGALVATVGGERGDRVRLWRWRQDELVAWGTEGQLTGPTGQDLPASKWNCNDQSAQLMAGNRLLSISLAHLAATLAAPAQTRL